MSRMIYADFAPDMLRYWTHEATVGGRARFDGEPHELRAWVVYGNEVLTIFEPVTS